MKFNEFEKWLEEKGFPIELNKWNLYLDLLVSWNEKMNLTAITDPEEILEKHFLDCLIPLTETTVSGSCADVGSGAGFPGIVFKIARPEIQMTLIEPTEKRCRFLREVMDQLDLKDVSVVNERAEDYVKSHRAAFDVVSARAVANLNVLSELCLPLVKTNGLFVAMKGAQGTEEHEKAKQAVSILGAKLETIQEAELPKGGKRVNLFYRKVKETPLNYPRHYGQIKKKPL